jgi:DNA polymerase III epsilon subunit-like protein
MKLKDCFPKDYLIFDTETSGLNPETDRLLEIAVLKIKDRKPENPPANNRHHNSRSSCQRHVPARHFDRC